MTFTACIWHVPICLLEQSKKILAMASFTVDDAPSAGVVVNEHTKYSLAASYAIAQANRDEWQACRNFDTVCRIIVSCHNQTKGADETCLKPNQSLPGLLSACSALGGPTAVFDFENRNGLWQRLVKTARQIEHLFPDGSFPTLSRRAYATESTNEVTVTLTVDQVACLMCHAFLSSLSRIPLPTCQNPHLMRETLPHYGSLSWHLVYASATQTATERVKGLLLYLTQILCQQQQHQERIISFRRVRSPQNFSLERALQVHGNKPLADVTFSHLGIECHVDSCRRGGLVDFANEDLHVGAVWPSATQEEIMFTVFPECFVGLLFCETMLPTEAIQIKGVRKFVDCHGFQHTFRVDGKVTKQSATTRQHGTTILAMDAAVADNLQEQCAGPVRDRDILKAFVAFNGLGGDESSSSSFPMVATGSWGCGAFGGNPYAKFIHQVIAASLAGVSLTYCLVGQGPESTRLKEDFTSLHQLWRQQKVTVADLYHGIGRFDGSNNDESLRNFLLQRWNG